MSSEKQITWFQVNNIVPLIASAVMIALSWAAINTRLALIEQKQDTLLGMIQEYQKTQAAQAIQVTDHSLRISKVEFALDLK